MKAFKSPLKISLLLQLQMVVLIYSFASVMSKIASNYEFLSLPFILCYGAEIALLGIYAILWQQMIQKTDLTIAYASRSVALFWSMLWAVLLFHETITFKNILGICIVLLGTLVVNSDA